MELGTTGGMGDPEPKSDVRMKSRGRQTLTGIGKKGAERQTREKRAAGMETRAGQRLWRQLGAGSLSPGESSSKGARCLPVVRWEGTTQEDSLSQPAGYGS